MTQSNPNLRPCIECGHMLSNTADACVNCGTRNPEGFTCGVCGIKAKRSEVVTYGSSWSYHVTCERSVLTFPRKELNCSDCHNVIGELKEEYLDKSKRTCKHCGSHRVFLFQGMPVEEVSKCSNCYLPIIAPLHQNHNSEQHIHDICLPFYGEKYPQAVENIRLLKMKSEAGDVERNYLSHKDNIDRAIKLIEEWVAEVDDPARRKIEYWRDGDQAFVLRFLKRNSGSNHNRGIIFNFRGSHFEVVFWSSYDNESFHPSGLHGTKRIRTGSIRKSQLNKWLYWLNTGDKEPAHILDADGRKSAKYAKGCYVLVAVVLIIWALLAVIGYLMK
jgi:hypothetical protein